MSTEKKPLTAAGVNEFAAPKQNLNPEDMFPTRDTKNNKIEVTDLFTHFTASIILEDVPFTR